MTPHQMFDEAVSIREHALGDDHPALTDALRESARIDFALGDRDQAVAKLQRASELFESARFQISDSALDRASFASRESPLRDLSAVLAILGKAEAAWTRYEQSLARALFDEVASRQALPLTHDERVTQDVQQLRLQRLDEEISNALNDEQPEPDANRLRGLRLERTKQRLETNASARRMSKKYGLKSGQLFDLERIQQSLDTQSAVLVLARYPLSFR